MTITELLPQLHHLSKSEKLTVIKFLVQELESEDLTPSESIFLSPQDWQQITDLLINSSPPNSALLSAVNRYNQEETLMLLRAQDLENAYREADKEIDSD